MRVCSRGSAAGNSFVNSQLENLSSDARFPLTRTACVLVLLALAALIYIGNAAQPPLLDDADASHALVAREMLERGDWAVLYMNGVRYLEKAPVHYWLVATTYLIAGQNAFTTRISLALAMIALVLVLNSFGRRFFGARAGFYSGIAAATGIGFFLFTRIMIPEAIFALELADLASICSCLPGRSRLTRGSAIGVARR